MSGTTQAFDPTILQFKLDADGNQTADGWDMSDIDLSVERYIACAVCRCLVFNIREHKAEHVAWHQRTEPNAGVV